MTSSLIDKYIYQRGTKIPDNPIPMIFWLPSVEFIEPRSIVQPVQKVGINIR